MYARVEGDLANARRLKNEAALRALGLLKSELVNASKEPGNSGDLTDELVVRVIRREVKKREEAATAFRTGGREERALAEEAESRVLSAYLPAQLEDADLEAEIRSIAEEVQPSGPGAYGALMKAATARLAGRADGARIAAVARRLLGG